MNNEIVILDGVDSYEALLNAEKHGAIIQLCSVGDFEEWTDFRDRQKLIGGTLGDFPANRYRAVIRAPHSAHSAEPVGWVMPSAMKNDGVNFTADKDQAENWMKFSGNVEPVYTQPQSAGVPDGWDIERESGDRITISADGLGFYVARMDAERIADIMLYALANDLLSTTPQPAGDDSPEACYWHGDDNGCWKGSCGIAWYFDDGGPDDNGVNHCPRCGRARVNEQQESES